MPQRAWPPATLRLALKANVEFQWPAAETNSAARLAKVPCKIFFRRSVRPTPASSSDYKV